ncbi:MAG: PKD domain-containing protein [Ignavibacteriales bacterium]|nr:PKD domain-containing protein [Ignavibacteriales bacterium]
MKKRIFIFIFAIVLVAFSSCKKDDNGVQPTENEPTFTDNIKTLQDKEDDLLSTLLAVQDTASALDSVLKVFLKDTTVLSGEVNSQGIAIKYKNGIIGGIFIDPEDGQPLKSNLLKTISLIPADINSFSPTSKKTIFINPHYSDRLNEANQILNLYNTIFPKIGYNPPLTFLDNTATIDVMTNLEGYGIIHIYSHGWAYPKKKSITNVYLMTGEEVNSVTNKKYENELLNGNIPIIKIRKILGGVHAGKTLYFLSPSFFSKKNDFSKDSTIVYGGFCFGFLGGWPNALIDVSKAGAYTGFTWRVRTDWNAELAQSIFDTLSNNSLKTSRTLDYWFTQTPTIPKQLWDNEDKLFCKIQYAGHSDLTLWSSADISISPNPAAAKPNESIKFTAKSKGKLHSQPKYKWNFGDGSAEQIIVNDSTVTHSFSNEGTFPVTVKLLDQSNNQLAAASSQAIITAEIVTPNFTKLYFDCRVGAVKSYSVVGKYMYYPTPFSHYLRDTSYSGNDTTEFNMAINRMYPMSISMSGNSFSGQYYGPYPDSTKPPITVSGSYDPIAKTVSATFTYTSSSSDQFSSTEWSESFSINSVPNVGNSSGIFCDIKGAVTCNYVVNISLHFVETPIPPYGVTAAGLKTIYDYHSFFSTDMNFQGYYNHHFTLGIW